MNNLELRKTLKKNDLANELAIVYDSSQYASVCARFLDVLDAFDEIFGERDDLHLFSAPGRSEVGGNHTDHNHGKVLAAGISLDAIAIATKNDENIIRIKSAGYNMDEVDCSDLSVWEKCKGKSLALVRGIAARFSELGYNVGGFDATTANQVLSGSGLSSSAAFEVLVCTMLNHLYNDGKISPVEIAKIAQYAENVHFGKPCGLLDQMACSVGGFVTIDFADPESPIIKKVDFDLSASGHSLVIVDTKGSHSDLTDDYAAVRSEMEAVAACLGKKVLRETTKNVVLANAAEIAKRTGERAVIRALHFFAENERVDKQVAALNAKDFETFKSLIIESGYSSYMYNQNVYTPKQPTNQPLALALAISESILKGKGAWRVHGGGFAGTIQAFVPNDLLENYTYNMCRLFGEDACYVLSVRPLGGVKLL